LKDEDKLATLEEGFEGTAMCLDAAADAATDAGAAEDEAAAVTTEADEHTHAVAHVTDAATDADSRSHTHPSHSQTSRLLSSSLSLGSPFPRSTQVCARLVDPPVLAFSLS
jgi:hypothetical protein